MTEPRPRIRDLEASSYAAFRPVWALTTGRSGTMWLTNLLNHCEGLRAVHEPIPPLFNVARQEHEGKLDSMTPTGWRTLLRVVRKEAVTSARHHSTTYVETTPLLSPLAPHLLEAFPGSRFLHLSRDPRAFACSAAARNWGAEGRQDHWWAIPQGGWGRIDRRIRDAPLVARCLWLWSAHHRLALRFQDEHPDRVLHAKAEDLWTNTNAVLWLLDWLGVPGPVAARMPNVVAMAQGMPSNTGKPVGWKSQWDKALAQLCGQAMARMGYA